MNVLVDPPPSDPFEHFAEWSARISDPAMCLSTVAADGTPRARVVPMSEVADRGFIFCTTELSHKGQELRVNPPAALTWYWAPDLQVRAEGTVSRTTEEKSNHLWLKRPPEAKLLASAVAQSQAVSSPATVDRALAALRSSCTVPDGLPRPPHWYGYLLTPARMEFWCRGDGTPRRAEYRLRSTQWSWRWLAP